MSASYRFTVTGRVQGVGFRYTAVQVARQLGLTGWIANREDGAVEGLAQGDAEALARFRDWLGEGPPMAAVDNVGWVTAEPEPVQGFVTRR